jgi:hypothetical protein
MEAEEFLTRPVFRLQLHRDPASVSQELNRFSGTPSNGRVSEFGFRRSGLSCGTTPIITAPESGCEQNTAIKVPIAGAERWMRRQAGQSPTPVRA